MNNTTFYKRADILGEIGAGFSVVGFEVKKLASRCQDTAMEINTLTANSVAN